MAVCVKTSTLVRPDCDAPLPTFELRTLSRRLPLSPATMRMRPSVVKTAVRIRPTPPRNSLLRRSRRRPPRTQTCLRSSPRWRTLSKRQPRACAGWNTCRCVGRGLAHLLLSMLMIDPIGWGSGGVKGNREGCAQLKGRTFFVLPSCGVASGNRSGTVLDFRHAPLSGDRLGVPRRDRLDGHRPDDADCGGQSPAPAAIPGHTHGPEGGDAGLR